MVTWEDRKEEVGGVCFPKPETVMGVKAGRGVKSLGRAELRKGGWLTTLFFNSRLEIAGSREHCLPSCFVVFSENQPCVTCLSLYFSPRSVCVLCVCVRVQVNHRPYVELRGQPQSLVRTFLFK